MTKKQPTQKSKPKKNNEKKSRMLEKPFEIGLYFGFTPIKTPSVDKDDLACLRAVRDPYYDPKRVQSDSPFAFDLLEKISLLRNVEKGNIENKSWPILISYKKPLAGTASKKTNDFTFGLEIFGLSGSVAEALLIRTTLSILAEEGYENLAITINSLGDKESISEFGRVVNVFVRKNMNSFPADIRKMAKHDVFEILRNTEEKHASVQEHAPKSMSFLSEESRNHFKEVLEYIESFDIQYDIAPNLIGSPTFCSHTIFEIRTNAEAGNELLAQGYWYSRLSKKIGMKREIPAVGVTISLKKKNLHASSRGIPRPKFYLIQLGMGAKISTLTVIENLRKAKLSVAHSLAKDKLTSQMQNAEYLKTPYVLIIGQKEALEKSVMVRNMSTHAQESVPVKDIVVYLKKLR
jgi:histidyl-tRNA synthetase